MKAFFGIIFAAFIAVAATTVTFCSLDKQFLTVQMDCEICDDLSFNIGVKGKRCCHLITDNITVLDSSNASCCADIRPPIFGLTTCQITSDCYQRFYGRDLSELSLYLNGAREDFSICNALVISTTPAYQTTTSCADCNATTTTTTQSSSSEAKIPSLLFITICQLLWIGFAS